MYVLVSVGVVVVVGVSGASDTLCFNLFLYTIFQPKYIYQEHNKLSFNSLSLQSFLFGYFLGFGAVSMLPMSFVYAISGFSIKVGYFNELIYGCKLT